MKLHMYTTQPISLPHIYFLLFLRYSPDKILTVKVTTAKSKVKSWSHHKVRHPHPRSLCQVSIWNLIILAETIFKSQGHYSKVKVKSRLHHDITYRHPQTKIPAMYQLPSFLNKVLKFKVTMARTNVKLERVLCQLTDLSFSIEVKAEKDINAVPCK